MPQKWRSTSAEKGSLKPGGSCIDPCIFCISDAAALSALVLASLRAAATRSSSIDFSDGESRLSSMFTARMRPFAVARIFTKPPPDAPSTSTLSRLSCAF